MPPELRLGYRPAGSTDDFTMLDAGVRLDFAGCVVSDWFPVPADMAADVEIAVFTIGGDDTTCVALTSLALETSVTTYTGIGTRDFSDDFSLDFS